MRFKFSQVVDYAYKRRDWAEAAVREFFPAEAAVDEAIKSRFAGLFNEWLIFDFKPAGGTSIARQYYLTNPDNLDQELMAELEQILKTQFYDLLEIEAIKKDSWLKLYSFGQKKRFRVWDKTASADDQAKGTLLARIGLAGKQWYFVGSDPLRLPLSFTDRYKKTLAKSDDFKITVKDALGLMLESQEEYYREKQKIYTKKELKNQRTKLARKYERLKSKYGYKLDFSRVVDFIYQENYQSHFGDMWRDLIKLGIPEAAMFNSLNLFQEIWNFFPHKILGGTCPAEKFGLQKG